MRDRIFYLQPFNSSNSIPSITITSIVNRLNTQLKISYKLQGDLEKIILPSSKSERKRKDNLWQTTCFEFFLAIFHSREYWEFNLAPTGNWNVYSFSNYRRDMKTAKAFTELPFKTKRNKSTYELTTQINLEKIISGNTPLEIAITTVIEDSNHNLSYWAITHPGTQPDFHRRDSFVTI